MSFIGVRLCKRKDFVLVGCGTYFIEDNTCTSLQTVVLCTVWFADAKTYFSGVTF